MPNSGFAERGPSPARHAAEAGRRRGLRLVAAVGLTMALLSLGGCKSELLDPQGRVGADELNLIVTSFVLMLLVVIPVIGMTLWFAWKFRASNTAVEHRPNWSHSVRIEVAVWGVPCAIILALSVITWDSTHALDPYRPLKSDQKPLVIQVVAEDWKWLFIYPEQKIATLNQIAIPVGRPVNFRITSDSVMNSFFVPQLGSQIYAMAGMETQDNLIADHPGTFQGRSAQYSGRGFSDMTFDVIATDQAGFDAWIAKVRASSKVLDVHDYGSVLSPSEKVPATFYGSVQPNLYGAIIDKYQGKLINMTKSFQE